MSRSRSLAGLLMIVLTLGFVTLGLQSANAKGYHAVVPHYAVGSSRIAGIAQDNSGHRLDDVLVKATGSGEATQFTYADEDGNGHGYFNLSVGRGTYTVTLSKEGYSSVTVNDVTVGRGKRVNLGTITLAKKATKTTTTATLVDSVVTTREHGEVEVAVKPGDAKPLGDIIVKNGRDTVGDATLTASKRGKITVEIEKLPRGTYELKVVYKGNKNFEGSTAKSVELTVKRARR